MVTLANVQGSSLVPDITNSLNLALDVFGTKQERDEQDRVRQAEIDRQASIDAELQNLMPDPTADPEAKRSLEEGALLRLARLDPEIAKLAAETIASGDDEAREALRLEAEKGARNAALISKQPDFASKQRALLVLAQEAAARGEPLERLIGLQNMSETELDLELQRMKIAAQDIKTITTPTERFTPVRNDAGEVVGQVSSTSGKVIAHPGSNTTGAAGKASAVTKIFQNGTAIQALPNGTVTVRGPSGDILEGAARIAALRTAREDDLEFAQAESGSKAAGSAAIAQSTKSFEQLTKVKTSIANIDSAIDLLDQGAGTGPIAAKLPSIRSASVALDNVQKAMGLDVIGTTTFGALSKGELDLALSKALPTGLDEDALREWLTEKRGAQEKLVGYLEDVAIFLGTPGNTVADWITIQKELRTSVGEPGAVLRFDSAGNFIE